MSSENQIAQSSNSLVPYFKSDVDSNDNSVPAKRSKIESIENQSLMLEEIARGKVLLEMEKKKADSVVAGLQAEKKEIEDEKQQLLETVKANEIKIQKLKDANAILIKAVTDFQQIYPSRLRITSPPGVAEQDTYAI